MNQPLAGRTILVTRAPRQAAPLVEAIRAAGGSAVEFPALAFEAVPAPLLQAALARIASADSVIFVSPNAAGFGMAAIGSLPRGCGVFAVGPGTARALAMHGVDAAITPDGQDSEALLVLPQLQDVDGKKFVIVRGEGGRALLGDTLAARGADVRYMECYRRLAPQADATHLLARWRAGGVDAVTVASVETLRNLAAMLGEAGAPLLARTPLFAPHEKIAAAARSFGIAQATATHGGDAGIVAGLVNWFRNPT